MLIFKNTFFKCIHLLSRTSFKKFFLSETLKTLGQKCIKKTLLNHKLYLNK